MAKKKKRRTLGDVTAFRCSTNPVYLDHEPLDRGGYANKGRGPYFGTGQKLWYWDNGESNGHLRAATKTAAKKAIIAKCPRTKFAKIPS